MTRSEGYLAGRDRYRVETGGLAAFVKAAWRKVDPSTLRWNWHHLIICDRLERVSRGEIRKLCIQVPPGTTKTLITSVFWPAWDWIENPQRKTIAGSYGDICLDAARHHRDLINDPWFQRRWPGVSIPYQNTRAASAFRNDMGGFRFSTSVKGPLTGRHANVHLGDDLNKAQDAMGGAAYTMVAMEDSWRWWQKVLPTRQVDPQTTVRVLIGQRLHERDVPGRWLAEEPDVHVICLPMHRDPSHEHACPPSTADMPGDDRDPGELLWPEHLPEAAVRNLQVILGPRDSSAQLEQRPSPDGGTVFRAEWFKYFRGIDYLTKGFKATRYFQSWDFAFDETPKSSFVVGGAYACAGETVRRIGQRRARADFTESCEMLVDLCLEWPETAGEVVVEKKANGAAIMSHMGKAYREICARRGVSNPPLLRFVSVNPHGSKLARAQGVTGLLKAGHLELPEDAPWAGEYVRELTLFTGGGAEIDDQVDETSQALTYKFGSSETRFADAMERAKKAMGRAA